MKEAKEIVKDTEDDDKEGEKENQAPGMYLSCKKQVVCSFNNMLFLPV